MSRGPGRVQRTVAELIAAEPHGSWNVLQLCKIAYPKQQVEKKHRVALMRAIHHMGITSSQQPDAVTTKRPRLYAELEPVWRWSDGYLFNAGDEESTLRLAFNKINFGRHKVEFEEWKQDAERIDNAREAVREFLRYHHASPIEKLYIDIAHAQRSAEFWEKQDLDLGSTYFARRIVELTERKAELERLATPPLPSAVGNIY